MSKTICGLDCSQCSMNAACPGCAATDASPFGGQCVIASCCRGKEHESCGDCETRCTLKAKVIEEFNALGIEDMEPVTDLMGITGEFINMTYTLKNGETVRFWDDRCIYLATQLPKGNSGRCYGLAADERYLMVCEYGENGADPEIVVYKKRK